ncbi:MAG TPA: lipid II flippase MurJ [Terriglobales bacterium]|nr:lipid II flippase MurJ [Terriglobales bacterium]
MSLLMWTAVARGCSALKEVLLAAVLGTGVWKDALVAAWTAPAWIASFGSETVPALLTPRWVAEGPGRLRGLMGSVTGALLVLSVAGVVWPRQLVHCLLPMLPSGTLMAAAALERWLALNIALLGLQAMLAAGCNASRQFAWPPAGTALAAAVVAVVVLVTRNIPLQQRTPEIAAAITAGNALGLGIQAAGFWRGRRRRPHPVAAPSQVPVARPLAGLLLAMLLLNSVPLAERMIAGGLSAGSLAAWDYGHRLVQFVFTLAVGPLTAVSFTRLAEAAGATAGGAIFARQCEQSLTEVLQVALPLAAVLATFAPLLTRATLGWGRFQAGSVALTAPVVSVLGGGIGLEAAMYFLLCAVYACGRPGVKLPLVLSLAAVNVPLAFWWGERWGVAGLAAAHLMGLAAALGWLAVRAARYLPGVRLRLSVLPGALTGGFALASAALARGLLPAAAVKGTLGPGSSCAWAAVALLLTAGGARGLAKWLAPVLIPSHARPRLTTPEAELA